MMNVKQALSYAVNFLAHSEAKIDAEYLLAKVLDKDFTWLKTWADFELSPAQQTQFLAWLKQRQQGKPIAYIIGEKGFWTLDLYTDESTLIPRAETECLVEKALDFLVNFSSASVLDLGCGTGAIALAIASERAQDEVFACDFHAGAVALAKKNAVRNQLPQVTIFQSDWFAAIAEQKITQTFDLIVANPPYVAADDPHLLEGDLIFEPNSALVSKDDGLGDIRHITQHAGRYLNSGGALMIEHGFEQGALVRDLFEQAGFKQVETQKDLLTHDRLTIGIW
ncbi:peptide chain release factor N(5)-glutamine methyltransferase [Aliikangiella maris]|uniref:Peptide chain release factor N(5)-glutamine methyltransferase n=2 Tax=Aliikangiella maris TaxID=3162458 RepID=A0ABV3MMY7_9GAMM